MERVSRDLAIAEWDWEIKPTELHEMVEWAATNLMGDQQMQLEVASESQHHLFSTSKGNLEQIDISATLSIKETIPQ